MSFIDNICRLADFNERVVVSQNRAGFKSSFVVDGAAPFSRRFLNPNDDGTLPPRLSVVWRLPLDNRSRSIRRGDKIYDAESQTWIVAETSVSSSLQLLSCQCFFTQLFPTENDFVDVLRPSRSGVFKEIAVDVPAIVRNQKTESANATVFPAATLVDEITFWVKSAILLRPNDVVVSNGTRFTVVSYELPSDVSEWSVLRARRLGGVDESWSRPKPK